MHRPTYDDWSLPKGKAEPGEHILLTAVREVWEETCIRPVLGPRLPTVEYMSWGRPKRVSYWCSSGDGHEAAPGNEIDAVAWRPLAQARELLAGTNDDPVISALRPVETVPLVLVRHASAGRKQDWPGSDATRPLDARGAADARVLASLMACFAPVARVISSPALRCTETVRPYAERFSGTVEVEVCLAPYGRTAHYPSRTEQVDALRRLLSALVADRRPAVLCLHGKTFRTWWPKRARYSAHPPRYPRTRRCPRAASGWRMAPPGPAAQGGSWPASSATSPSATTYLARDDPRCGCRPGRTLRSVRSARLRPFRRGFALFRCGPRPVSARSRVLH